MSKFYKCQTFWQSCQNLSNFAKLVKLFDNFIKLWQTCPILTKLSKFYKFVPILTNFDKFVKFWQHCKALTTNFDKSVKFWHICQILTSRSKFDNLVRIWHICQFFIQIYQILTILLNFWQFLKISENLSKDEKIEKL